MKLTVDKSSFVDSILIPASKLSDNLSLRVKESRIATLVTSGDNSVILQSSIPCDYDNETPCIIPDCKSFLRLFSGIGEESATLHVEENLISHKSKNFSFKYHLLDENYFGTKKTISEDKLDQLTFDTEFSVTKQKFSEILKYNSIIPDAEKLYFVTEGTKVFAKLGDEQKSNTNEIVTEVNEGFEGKELLCSIPINIQNILLFSFSSDEITVKINHQLKVFKFESPSLSYIVSGLVK